MIPELGLFSLILALGFALTGMSIPLFAYFYPNLPLYQKWARSSAYGQGFFVLIGFLTLMFCFVQDDFSVAYIAKNSNTHLPLIYKWCALWGAHEGSLLLWSFVLSIWMMMVARFSHQLPKPIAIRVLGILGAVHVGFLLLLLHTSNPFERILPYFPTEGGDLNPLLQDPGFIIHPPFLYMGYVGFSVPFAFALAALTQKDQNIPWAVWARPWALLAFGFLTVGIVLGSWWAYYELGWGGWWFWDPVENASFMPWLVGAALIHALYSYQKRSLFSNWGILLAMSAFFLSLMGTFLVRSGVLSSVHAFATDPLRGTFILSFLSIVLATSVGLYWYRFNQRQESVAFGLFSKGSFILLGNIILFVAMLTVMLGTLYPLILEVLNLGSISVGPPYYQTVFVPMMLVLLFLMIVAPHIFWDKDNSLGALKRSKKALIFLAAVAVIMALIASKLFSVLAIVGCVLGVWVIISALLKCKEGLNLSRFSMIIAHMGIGFFVLGATLTTTLDTEKDLQMQVGESLILSGYEFTFQSIKDIKGSNFEGMQAHFTAKRNNKVIAQMYPEKRFFIPRNLPMSETAIHAGLWGDLYIALGEKLDNGWSVRLYIKPFIRWIWLGGLMIAFGAWCASAVAFREHKLRRVE